MKYLSLSIFLLSLSLATLSAQNTARIIDWKLLSKVEFVDRYFEEFEAWYLVPKFSEQVKALDEQTIIIKGYMIPLDVDGGQYALSAYPFSACFFCGGAGPESVISLKFADKPRRYETDEVVRIKGKLVLNSEDFEEFNYILEDCEAIEK